MGANSNSNSYYQTIKMVETAMDVLDFIRTTSEPIGVNAVSKQFQLNPSTGFRILKTLEKKGWIYQMEDDRYICGEKLCFSTEKNNFFLALADVAKPIMDACTAKHGIAMNLMVRKGADCEIIQQSHTKSMVSYIPPLFTVIPYYICAAGKILLSELPTVQQDEILHTYKLEAYTPYTITSRVKMRKELKAAAKNGYAIDFQESSINGSCIAVPVRDKEKTIVASLSFSGLIGISAPEVLVQYIPALQEAAKKISANLYKSWLAE